MAKRTFDFDPPDQLVIVVVKPQLNPYYVIMMTSLNTWSMITDKLCLKYPATIFCAGYVAAWFALWHLAVLGNSGSIISLWYPPAGLTLALLLAGGRKWLPLAFAAPWLVNLTVEIPRFEPVSVMQFLLVFFGPPTAHVLGYGAAAFGMRHAGIFKTKDRDFSAALSPAVVLLFALFALAGAMIASSAGVTHWLLRSPELIKTWKSFFLHWCSGDFIGVVTITPLALLTLSHLGVANFGNIAHSFRPYKKAVPRFPVDFFVAMAITIVTICLLHYMKGNFALPIPYSLILLVGMFGMLFVALRFNLPEVACASAALGFTSAMLVSTTQDYDFVVELNFYSPAWALGGLLGFSLQSLVDRNRALTTETILDPLTKLLNRKGFEIQLDECLQNVQGGRRRLCIAALDLDHFKQINDSHGHAVGDAVLRHVADTLIAGCGTGNRIGRVSGEEITVLFPGISLSEAKEKASELCAAIAAIDGLPCKVTASFGVIQVDQHETAEQVLQRADQLLYQAKRLGRNRVETDLETPLQLPHSAQSTA